MVQMPPNVTIEEGTSTKGKTATHLEGIVNRYAAEGW